MTSHTWQTIHGKPYMASSRRYSKLVSLCAALFASQTGGLPREHGVQAQRGRPQRIRLYVARQAAHAT